MLSIGQGKVHSSGALCYCPIQFDSITTHGVRQQTGIRFGQRKERKKQQNSSQTPEEDNKHESICNCQADNEGLHCCFDVNAANLMQQCRDNRNSRIVENKQESESDKQTNNRHRMGLFRSDAANQFSTSKDQWPARTNSAH